MTEKIEKINDTEAPKKEETQESVPQVVADESRKIPSKKAQDQLKEFVEAKRRRDREDINRQLEDFEPLIHKGSDLIRKAATLLKTAVDRDYQYRNDSDVQKALMEAIGVLQGLARLNGLQRVIALKYAEEDSTSSENSREQSSK